MRAAKDLIWISDRLAIAVDVENLGSADPRSPAHGRLVIVAKDGDEMPVPASLTVQGCLELSQLLMGAATLIDPVFVARFVESSKAEAALTRALADLPSDGPTN